MRKTRDILIALAALVALTTTFFGAAMATDYQTLRDDARVHNELLGASTAYLIVEQCALIKLRKLRLVGKALSLKSYAKGLGYTGQEVDAYVNDLDEQARFRTIAMGILVDKGAVNGDTASYCTVGRAEIAADSFVGAILRGG